MPWWNYDSLFNMEFKHITWPFISFEEMLHLSFFKFSALKTQNQTKWKGTQRFMPVQCVPIKRKPVLSVRYLHCHARLKQTVCFIIKSIFSSFIWYQTHNDISMHEWKGTI